MVQKTGKLDDAIVTLGNLAEKNLVDHPDIAELADYLDNLLPEEDMNLVRSHLSLCQTCTQSLLRLESDAPVENLPLSDDNMAMPAHQKTDKTEMPRRGLFGSPVFAWANAAVLMMALIISLLYVVKQQKQIQESKKPSQTFLLELSPLGESFVKGGEDSVTAAAPVGNKLNILLDAVGLQPRDVSRLVIRDESGILHTMQLATLPADGFISIWVPGNYSSGCYFIDLENEIAEKRATYRWCLD